MLSVGGLPLLTTGGLPAHGATFQSDFDFGALTLAGDGGIPKPGGASSITGGTATGIELVAGYLVPTGDGSVGAGTVIWNDGTVWILSTIADSYSVKDFAEHKSLWITTGMVYGQTILCRAGTYDGNSVGTLIRPLAITGSFVRHGDLAPEHYQGKDVDSGTYVTVRPHAGDTVLFESSAEELALGFDNFLGTPKGIRYTGSGGALTFSNPVDETKETSSWTVQFSGEDLTIDNCTIQALGFVFASGNSSHSGVLASGDFFTIQDCIINGVNTCIQSNSGTNLVIVGNTLKDALADAIHYSMNGDDVDNLIECWNIIYRKDAMVDSGVHSDWTQAFGPTGPSANWARVGNRYFIGKAKESVAVSGQGFYSTPGASGRQVNHLIAGNFLSIDTARGTTDGRCEGLDLYHNTIVNDFAYLGAQSGIFIQNIVAGSPNSVDVRILNNVTNQISINDATDTEEANNDVSLNITEASYTDLFVDPKGGADLTLANMAASFAPKVAGALDVADHIPIIGCFAVAGRTQMVDFDARTVDFPIQEAGFTPSITDLTDVALSTAVEATFQVTGVSATGAECWITGASATMEIRQSDDSTVIIGSVPVDEHHIIYANEYIHINDTSSGSNSTQIDVVFNIGTKSDTFSHTTVAA